MKNYQAVRWSIGALALTAALAACGGGTSDGGGGNGGSGGSATTGGGSTSDGTTTSGSTGGGSTTSSTTTTTSTGSMDCPSYSGEVAQILATYCVTCHGPGGQEAKKPLNTYASAAANSLSIKHEINVGKMPPAGSPKMSTEERDTLFAWIACGAPNN